MWVLIVLSLHYNHADTVTMQEFNSRESCTEAAKVVMLAFSAARSVDGTRRQRAAMCVEK